MDIGEREKTGLTVNDEAPVGKIIEEGDYFSKKEISAEEAIEFLRIIQQSEFKVIEQLNKTPARISLLGLLMNFEPHRALLVKILNEPHLLFSFLLSFIDRELFCFNLILTRLGSTHTCFKINT